MELANERLLRLSVPVEINERWLSEVGGWQVLKVARGLVQGGAVEDATREGNTFKGLVRSGRGKLSASLTPTGPKDATCRCACPDSAARGLVCAHAIAVALAVVEREKGAGAYQSQSQTRSLSNRGPARSSSWSAATYSKPGAPSTDASPAKSPAAPAAVPAPVALEALPKVMGTFTLELDVERMIQAAAGKRISLMLRLAAGSEPADVRIVQWLVSNGAPCTTQPMALPPEDLSGFLQKLEGYGHIAPLAKSGKVNNQGTLNINVLEGFVLSARLKGTDSVVFEWDKAGTTPFFLGPDLWNFHGGTLRFLAGIDRTEIGSLCREMVRDGLTTRPVQWLIRQRGTLENLVTLRQQGELEQLRIEQARPVFQVELDGSLRELQVTLSALLGGQSHRLGAILTDASGTIYPFQDETDKMLYYVRNVSRERAVQEHFKSLGFQETAAGALKLSGEEKILSFFGSELPKLKKLFQVIEGERWKAATRGVQRIQPQVRMPQLRGAVPGAGTAEAEQGSGGNWLTLEVAYTADNGFQVSRNEVLRLLRGGRNNTRGPDGKIYVLDEAACEELDETLEDAHSEFQSGQKFRIAADAGELLAAYSPEPTALLAANAPMLAPEDVAEGLGELGDLLRPYQREGVRWMERLHRVRRGGLLADEMGLGKTLQSLAMLRLLVHSQGKGPAKDGVTHPALVVCPTSLLYNWAAEVAKFTPEIPCTVLHGDDRKAKLKALDAPGVVITSYGLISRDLDWYLRRPFQTLIMDEASHLRNPDTDAAKALRMVRAHSRFALTGTPVENSVRDLWSIFQIVVPGHLGSREEFRDRYQKPIASGSAPEDRAHAAMRLRRRTGPYVLRRTKREVAKDLPPRLERVIWCELTDLQKEWYQRILEEGREEIRQARRRSGNQGARATMFTVLLRLRQICNDLRLLGLDEKDQDPDAEVTPAHGGKWSVICDFLEEVRENNGKALIFSQFVSMLKLLKPQVAEAGLGLCYLDGQSSDRPEQVAAFQTDAQRQIFLISLKAGGYGLTLTAADQVVLYDPWWNPAVEAQAIDRAHRIGQTQPVTAIRLATRGTVEEKILQLQAKKREAAEQTIDDNPVIMPGITEDDLEMMLE